MDGFDIIHPLPMDGLLGHLRTTTQLIRLTNQSKPDRLKL